MSFTRVSRLKRIQRHFTVACGARAPVVAKAAMGGLPTRIRVTRCRSPGNRGSRQHEGDANTSQAWARIERSKGVPARRVRVAEFGRRRSGSKKRQYGVNPRGREREPSASGGVRDLTEAAVLGERRSVENRVVVAKSRYRRRAESVPHRRKRGWGQGFGCRPREGTSGRGSRRFSRGDGGIGLGGPRSSLSRVKTPIGK